MFSPQCAAPGHVEHPDRHAVVPGQADRGQVHDGQFVPDDRIITQCIEFGRFGIALGIGGVYAVHPGRLEYDFRADFDSPQTGGGIGGEQGIAGASGKDDGPALFEVANRGMALELFDDSFDAFGGQDAGRGFRRFPGRRAGRGSS